MKYAFIFDAGKPAGKEHYCFVGNGNEVNLVQGVSPRKEAAKRVLELADQGYQRFGLCGAFDAASAGQIQEQLGDRGTITFISYLPEQQQMVDSMNSFREYGILIQADGLFGTARFILDNEACNAKICFVPDWNHAKEAVRTLQEEGIYFIECCGYFKAPMVRELIEMTGGMIPIGSTGLYEEA